MKPTPEPLQPSNRPAGMVEGIGFGDDQRREAADRRQRVWWSLMYGGFRPRRRRPPRRESDARFQSLDWHAPHLLAVSIGILLLSFADALMTVRLLSGGADELNPVMAMVVESSASLFAWVKIALTGLGVIIMVLLARYRFMRVIPVEVVMYAVLLAYSALLAYEFWMLGQISQPFDF